MNLVSGKSGGGSFEIETLISGHAMRVGNCVARAVVAHLRLKPIIKLAAPCNLSRGKSGGGSFEIETRSWQCLWCMYVSRSGKSGGGSFEIETHQL